MRRARQSKFREQIYFSSFIAISVPPTHYTRGGEIIRLEGKKRCRKMVRHIASVASTSLAKNNIQCSDIKINKWIKIVTSSCWMQFDVVINRESLGNTYAHTQWLDCSRNANKNGWWRSKRAALTIKINIFFSCFLFYFQIASVG